MPAQRPEATFETRNTYAASPGLRLETRNTFVARPDHHTETPTTCAAGKTFFLSLLTHAEVPSVSPTHQDRRAKVPMVSQRSIYPHTSP